jgi:SAM-dependent methyltransferase
VNPANLIPFNKPYMTGKELWYIAQAHALGNLAGDGSFTKKCNLRGVELLQMDARRLPYVDEFDVIGAFDVLEHIEEDEAVLQQMWQALRPAGGVILTVHQHPWLWSRQDEHACHVRRYRVGELQEKVVRAGFEVVLQTSFVSLLLPAMAASRLLQRDSSAADAGAELRLPAPLNFAFSMVMHLERGLIRAGARLPVGGSLLIIAMKRG